MKKHTRSLLLSTFLIATLAACAPMQAQSPPASEMPLPVTNAAPPPPAQPANAPLYRLRPLIGTYDYAAVWNDPNVAAKLASLSPDSPLRPRMENLFGVKNPIGYADNCLTLEGIRPHQGDVTAAFMLVCLARGDLHIALKDAPAFDLYTTEAIYDHVPAEMRQWLTRQINDPLNSGLRVPPRGIDFHPAR